MIYFSIITNIFILQYLQFLQLDFLFTWLCVLYIFVFDCSKLQNCRIASIANKKHTLQLSINLIYNYLQGHIARIAELQLYNSFLLETNYYGN